MCCPGDCVECRASQVWPEVEGSNLGAFERGDGAGEEWGVFLDIGVTCEDWGEKRLLWVSFLGIRVEVSLVDIGEALEKW